MNMTFQKEGKTFPCSCRYCDFAFKKTDMGTIGKWIADCRFNPPGAIAFPGPGGIVNMQFQFPMVTDSPLSFCSHFTERKDGE